MIRPSFAHRLRNWVQTALILGGMATLAWVVLTSLFGAKLALWFTVLSLAGLAFAPSFSRELLLWGYRAREIQPQDWPEGVALVALLAKRAGLPRPPELWYVPSQLANAFAMGRPEESVVCLTAGLIRLLSPRELAGVLAHEIAHIAHRDLWLMGLADAMSRAVSVASWLGQILLLVNLPLMITGAAIIPWTVPLLLIFAPTIMALLQLSLSRQREYDADLGAAMLTGDPEALAAALLKIERRTGRFWEEMFFPGRRIPEPSVLRTHPPTEERVSRLLALAREGAQDRALGLEGVLGPAWPRPWAHLPPPPRPRFHRSGFWF